MIAIWFCGSCFMAAACDESRFDRQFAGQSSMRFEPRFDRVFQYRAKAIEARKREIAEKRISTFIYIP